MDDDTVPRREPFGMVPLRLLTDPKLTNADKVMYAYLAARFGGYQRTGRDVCPSVSRMAVELGWGASTVRAALSRLETSGWLCATPRAGSTQLYRLR